MKAVYAGSFSPPTVGHLDIIGRAAGLFDELVVAVMVHGETAPAFTQEERVRMLRRITGRWPNVRVVADQGLTVDLVRREGADVLIRGLRGAEDLRYEQEMAQANRSVAGVETLFMSCAPENVFLSSSIVRDCARHGADLSGMVPDEIAEEVLQAFRSRKAAERVDRYG